ncbi:MAG: hypothetical protein HWN68_16640 [Desulfobacterales bacterium]|nr:hypothetical protein [Desulfobacterales bacterium]
MSFDNRRRRVGLIKYVASTPVPLDLPRKHLIRDLILDVEPIIDITDVTQAPVLYTGGLGSALKHIARVEIIANGRDTIKSISGDAIGMKNMFLFGTKPKLTECGLTVAEHTCGGKILLPFAMPRSIREIDTLLNSGKLATLELIITYGPDNAMFSTDPTAFTVTSVDVEVHVNESIRLDRKDEPYASYMESYIEKAITAATTEFQVLLNVGNRYRGFLIECESDGNMVDTLLNKVTIKSGTDVFASIAFDALQGENIIKYDLKTQTLIGYAYLDFCPEGRMVDCLDASRLSSLEMILDVNSVGSVDKIRVYPCEMIPPAPV